MKILHCCLACFYVDGFGYQENILPIYNQKDGHEVMIIASTETFLDGMLSYIKPSTYTTETGIPIVRLPYTNILPHGIAKKIRYYPGFMDQLESFKPDIILFHGTTAYDIITVAYYKKLYPHVKLYVDCHEAYYNSAQNILSKYVLHKMLYRKWFRKALPYIDKVLYVGTGEREYLIEMMGLKDDEMEFYPLGGVIIDQTEKQEKRKQVYYRHGLSKNHILFVHSGKLNALKRTTDLLCAFSRVKDERFRLVIIGNMPKDTKIELETLINKDSRVQFIGWKSQDILREYLAAADMYLQPGSVSATLQNAICCGTPVMIYPHECYNLFVKKNGVRVLTVQDMVKVFTNIQKGILNLEDMSRAAIKYALEYLDYRKLAKRLYT